MTAYKNAEMGIMATNLIHLVSSFKCMYDQATMHALPKARNVRDDPFANVEMLFIPGITNSTTVKAVKTRKTLKYSSLWLLWLLWLISLTKISLFKTKSFY